MSCSMPAVVRSKSVADSVSRPARVLAVALLTLGAAACAAPLPTAPPPVVVCADPPEQPSTTLTCNMAVAAALAALPDDHLPIVGTEFAYGSCLPGSLCPVDMLTGTDGVVIFSTAGDGPDLWVRVAADSNGTVSVVDEGATVPWAG